MVRHSAVIYKSRSGNKIRLRGCVEMDLLNITINYCCQGPKLFIFMAEGKTKAAGGFKWVYRHFSLEQPQKKIYKENIDFQLKDTNVYITTEAINFLTYGEKQEQQRHRSFTTHCRHLMSKKMWVFAAPKINHFGCFPLN